RCPTAPIPRLLPGADQPKAVGCTPAAHHQKRCHPDAQRKDLQLLFRPGAPSFRSFIAGGGRPQPSSSPSHLSHRTNSAPSFWRGPAEGSWPHAIRNAVILTHSGRICSCFSGRVPHPSAVLSRGVGDLSPHPAQASCPTAPIPRLLSGADQPKAVGRTAGAWPQRRCFAENYASLAHTVERSKKIEI